MGKEIPTGVKVISVVYYVFAAIAVIASIFLFSGASTINSILGSIPIIGILGALGSGLFIFGAIVCLIFGTLSFFIGRGLWKAKKWARIIVIVFSVIGVLIGLASLAKISFGGIVQLAISGTIGGYLIFSKKVKGAFK